MAFTPSNLYVVNVGSANLYIGKVNANIMSGTNAWNSSITNIIAAWGSFNNPLPSTSGSGIAVGYTASNGTIYVDTAAESSGAAYTLYVLSGIGLKGT